MKLTLCYAPIACSLVPLINLNEAGASFEVRKINLRKGENMTPDYLAMNPLHKVPVLIVDGRALTENVAINSYIARTYPAAKLFPSNSMDELEAISMMGWFSGGLHPHLTRIFNPTRFCDAPGSEEVTRALAKKALEENFAAADKRLAGREFFFDHFTAPDAHFFWCARRATQLDFKVDGYANVVAHHNRLHQRDSVKKALNGYSPAGTLGTIEFVGSGGATQTFSLVSNGNVRDFYNGVYANSLNSPPVPGSSAAVAFQCSTPSCSGGGGTGDVTTGASGTYRVDEQDFVLNS